MPPDALHECGVWLVERKAHRACFVVPHDPVVQRRSGLGLAVLARELDQAVVCLLPGKARFPDRLEIRRAAHVLSRVARVVDEGDSRLCYVAQVAQEFDDGRNALLLVLVSRRRLHSRERVEDEQARLDALAGLDQARLPVGVVELDSFVRSEQQSAQLLARDRATAAKRIKPAPAGRSTALLDDKDDWSRLRDRELAEGWLPRHDRDG